MYGLHANEGATTLKGMTIFTFVPCIYKVTIITYVPCIYKECQSLHSTARNHNHYIRALYPCLICMPYMRALYGEQGAVLNPNTDEWWGFDTTHCGVGDVQSINTDKVPQPYSLNPTT